MRVSVPGIPQSLLSAAATSSFTIAEAVDRLVSFIRPGNVVVLTGAGVSVDSGIRAYRGRDGRYMNPNYKPIFYHELMDATDKGRKFRQRYWLRSYLGYPPVRDAIPNTTHFALAALQYTSFVSHLITQNVDGLHHKAMDTAMRTPHLVNVKDHILELHGTLHRARCNRGHSVARSTFQDWLSSSNPSWYRYAKLLEETGEQPRTNPDGDVAIEHLGKSYLDFVIPQCPTCMDESYQNNVFKPEVVFFGESIPSDVKEKSFRQIEEGDRLLLIGTTLATYSAFRLVKRALELHKPVMLLNVGPTRADDLQIQKIDLPSGTVLTEVAREVMRNSGVVAEDSVVKDMLASGIVKPPLDDFDRAPRAAS
ncbi:DHS-like NAD/FAD-binding domain-containing protein [Cyathus striatus]|nr:DHS-like NAD/FAD-binding domain-containing protein [Cyathus striatus]